MSEPPLHEYRARRRVEFADTDQGGIVHFARYFVFMETAEHECLRQLGCPVHSRVDGREIAWPRVQAACEFLSPLHFEDLVEIVVRVRASGRSSLGWSFELRVGERLAARGEMTTVCCVMRGADEEGLRSIPIPETLASRLAPPPRDS